MSQLIALIIAIALGAIVTAIGYVFLGDVFSDSSHKAKAQQLLAQEQQIDAAITQCRVNNGGKLFLGNSDPNGDSDYSDSEIFQQMSDSGCIEPDLINSEFNWHIPAGEHKISADVKDPNVCISANAQNIRTQYPKEGIRDGYIISSTITALAAEISDGIPICNTTTATGAACCVNP